MPAKTWKDLMTEANEGAKAFALLEEDTYSFVIKDAAKVGQTGKGNPKFTINPSVEAGPRANARIWHDFSVSDSAYAMKNFFFGDLATLGLGPSFFDQNPSPEQIAQALQGKRFVARVVHEVGNDGVKRAKITDITAPVGSPIAGPQAGVPAGLPQASVAPQPSPALPTAPAVQNAAPVAPQAATAAPSPWDNVAVQSAPAPAPAAPISNSIPIPPPFGN